MHNIKNLTTQISEKSKALAQARSEGDEESAERLEDELYELEEELEDAEEAARDGSHGWN
jgi:uncharacterized protein involved in exopolysaccharide biosynthesis